MSLIITEPRLSKLGLRLAKVLEAAMLKQHGRTIVVKDFYIAKGFERSDPASDTYRWTAVTVEQGLQTGPMIDSYDTMTNSARYGVTLMPDKHPSNYEAVANEEIQND